MAGWAGGGDGLAFSTSAPSPPLSHENEMLPELTSMSTPLGAVSVPGLIAWLVTGPV